MTGARMLCGAFCLAGMLSGTVWAQEIKPQKTLEELILIYDQGNSNPYRDQLIAMGQTGMDGIFDAMDREFLHGPGRIRPGATAEPTYGPLRYASALLKVAREIDAPLPVDRLCLLVETESGYVRDEALYLLACSGHEKGLAYLEYCRDRIKDSFSDADRQALKPLDADIQRWHAARKYITEGVAEDVSLYHSTYEGKDVAVPYKVDTCTEAMRRVYQNDPSALAWKGVIDLPYLEKRYEEVRAAYANMPEGRKTRFGTGEFFEDYLAPKVLAWLNGDVGGLETALSGRKGFVESLNASSMQASSKLYSLCSEMTGPTALEVKLKLMRMDRGVMHDYIHTLQRHDPGLWMKDYLAVGSRRTGSGYGLLVTLAKKDTALTPEEEEALADILATPKLSVPHDAQGAKDNALTVLAGRYPQAFQDALKAQHISAAVVDVIMQTGMCNDEALLLDRMEYAMKNDYIIDYSKMSPEQRAKLPPSALAHMKGGIDGPPQLRIGDDWLKLLAARFKDSKAALQMLQRFKEKGGLTPASEQDVNRAIERILAAHPEWEE